MIQRSWEVAAQFRKDVGYTPVRRSETAQPPSARNLVGYGDLYRVIRPERPKGARVQRGFSVFF